MTEKDFNSGPDSHEPAEPLSATAMFLRSFDSAPEPQQAQPETPLAAPAPPPAAAPTSGPG